jgi:hypothetical protein
MWAVMNALEARVTVPGIGDIPTEATEANIGGPCCYMPLFWTRVQAVAFAGSDRHVREVEIVMRTETMQGGEQ